MRWSRRSFLKFLVLVGGAQLAGCLGGSDSEQVSTEQPAGPDPVTQTGSSASVPATTPSALAPPAGPAQQPLNSVPVWQPAPTIQFVEGVPMVIPVRQFVQDLDRDPLVIQLKSGVFLPGITWNPTDATITYDGRPLGARPERPVLVSGVTFSADDQKN